MTALEAGGPINGACGRSAPIIRIDGDIFDASTGRRVDEGKARYGYATVSEFESRALDAPPFDAPYTANV